MLRVGSGAGIDSVTSYHPTLKPYNKASTVSLDLGLSSPSARVPILIAVPAMAEVDLTSVATTGTLSAHASILAPLQHDVDVLKREINDLSTVVGSLIKEIKDLKQAKVETVCGVFSFLIGSHLATSVSVHDDQFTLFFPDHRFHLLLRGGV